MPSRSESPLPHDRSSQRTASIREQRAAREAKKPKTNPMLIAGAVLALAAVGIGIKFVVGAASRIDTRVAVRDAAGKPFLSCKLELFEFDRTPAAPTRPRKLGEVASKQTDSIVVPHDMVPEYSLARATVDGVGVAAFLVHKGEHAQNAATLTPAVPIAGRVQDASGQAVHGARVQAVDGGERGIVLAEATSAADGSFTLAGVSPSNRFVTLWVFKAGHAQVEKPSFAFDAPLAVACQLVRTEPVTGRVVVPNGVTAGGLVVQAYALPGIAATTDASGAFRLDHLPPQSAARLLVQGLPSGHTHRAATARAGQRDVEIAVTRACQISGTVVDGRSGQIPHLAVARHDHGPRGEETFKLDEFGRFLLPNVPEGMVTIEAFVGVEREKDAPYAALQLEFKDGESKRDVAFTLK